MSPATAAAAGRRHSAPSPNIGVSHGLAELTRLSHGWFRYLCSTEVAAPTATPVTATAAMRPASGRPGARSADERSLTPGTATARTLPAPGANSVARTARHRHTRPMTLSVQCLCFDTADPGRIARFWAAALGWRVTYG